MISIPHVMKILEGGSGWSRAARGGGETLAFDDSADGDEALAHRSAPFARQGGFSVLQGGRGLPGRHAKQVGIVEFAGAHVSGCLTIMSGIAGDCTSWNSKNFLMNSPNMVN